MNAFVLVIGKVSHGHGSSTWKYKYLEHLLVVVYFEYHLHSQPHLEFVRNTEHSVHVECGWIHPQHKHDEMYLSEVISVSTIVVKTFLETFQDFKVFKRFWINKVPSLILCSWYYVNISMGTERILRHSGLSNENSVTKILGVILKAHCGQWNMIYSWKISKSLNYNAFSENSTHLQFFEPLTQHWE